MNTDKIPDNKKEIVKMEAKDVDVVKNPEITAYERRLNEQRTPRLD